MLSTAWLGYHRKTMTAGFRVAISWFAAELPEQTFPEILRSNLSSVADVYKIDLFWQFFALKFWLFEVLKLSLEFISDLFW